MQKNTRLAMQNQKYKRRRKHYRTWITEKDFM